MSAGSADDHLAILIDGDNVSSKIIAGLMTEVVNYGTASVRRIYGDWTSPQMKGWRECLLEHSISPVQQFAYTTGKNATDGAMIIDAMDLLYTGRFSSFCIVSSDSDFTRLAARIREQGISVYGFGNRNNTHRAFIAACNKFVYFDALPMPAEEIEESAAPSSSDHSKPPIGSSDAKSLGVPAPRHFTPTGPRALAYRPPYAATFSSRYGAGIEPAPKPLDQAALAGLRQAILSSNIYEDDFVNLAEVGAILNKIAPDLNPRNYGYLRLKDFVEKSGVVELKMKYREPAPPIAMVRLKDTNAAEHQIM